MIHDASFVLRFHPFIPGILSFQLNSALGSTLGGRAFPGTGTGAELSHSVCVWVFSFQFPAFPCGRSHSAAVQPFEQWLFAPPSSTDSLCGTWLDTEPQHS